VNAHLQLGENAEAIRAAEKFLAVHPRESGLLSALATAYERTEQIAQAVAPLTRLAEADPAFPNVALRQGVLLLNQNRLDDAVPFLKLAVERGAVANDVARQILGWVGRNGLSREKPNYAEASKGMEAAKTFPVTPEQMQEFDFYLAVALYQRGVELQDGAVPSLGVARQTKPMFDRVKTSLASARPWAQASPNAGTWQQLNDGADTYLTIVNSVSVRPFMRALR
jgi:tetratricopeptide (TPR) repeat protein